MTSGGPPGTDSLRKMLRGYFHQDVIAEHGSIEAAARAYRAEAPPAERWRAARQLRVLLAGCETVEDVRDAFAALRSGWRPRDLRSVERVLAILETDGSVS
ncbi:MAG TPA: contact-dependent growth inhibition system immunity protein [Dehalococcoidia bacterium]|nr:contact-dependent growth inhibition system immunity protein [Dehalococcoidia bacterium]